MSRPVIAGASARKPKVGPKVPHLGAVTTPDPFRGEDVDVTPTGTLIFSNIQGIQGIQGGGEIAVNAAGFGQRPSSSRTGGRFPPPAPGPANQGQTIPTTTSATSSSSSSSSSSARPVSSGPNGVPQQGPEPLSSGAFSWGDGEGVSGGQGALAMLRASGSGRSLLSTPSTNAQASPMSAFAPTNGPNGASASSKPHHGSQLVGKIEWSDLTIGHEIGQGTAGKVREVQHNATKKRYALKMIKLDGKMTKKQLRGELSHLFVDKHPHLVHSANAYYMDGTLKILMEYMDVGTLSSIVDKIGPLPENVLSVVTAQMLKGLEVLHALSIVHRDIKPKNILLNSMGLVKVSDFGLAKVVNQACPITITGTTAFMSPERVRGDTFNPIEDVFLSDIWSVGLTVAQCALGVYPFVLETPAGRNPFSVQLNPFVLSTWLADGQAAIDFDEILALIRVHRPEKPPPTAITRDLIDFVKLCMRQNVKERPTCSQLLQHPFITNHAGQVILQTWLDENGLIVHHHHRSHHRTQPQQPQQQQPNETPTPPDGATPPLTSPSDVENGSAVTSPLVPPPLPQKSAQSTVAVPPPRPSSPTKPFPILPLPTFPSTLPLPKSTVTTTVSTASSASSSSSSCSSATPLDGSSKPSAGAEAGKSGFDEVETLSNLVNAVSIGELLPHMPPTVSCQSIASNTSSWTSITASPMTDGTTASSVTSIL